MSSKPFSEPPTFRVLEIFGPTVQGEGRLAGTSAYFIRFAGCDLRCEWCDSPAAVLPEIYTKEATRMTAQEIAEAITELPVGPKWVVLTGGNPGLLKLSQLVARLHSLNYKVMVETQGTIWKDWFYLVDDLCISPKPPSSGNPVTPEIFKAFLDKRWTPNEGKFLNFYSLAYLKVVVFDEEDYEYAVLMHQKFPKFEFFVSAGTMTPYLQTISNPDPPEHNFNFDSLSDIRERVGNRYRWLCEKISNDYRMKNVKALPQLHVIAWGDERGR